MDRIWLSTVSPLNPVRMANDDDQHSETEQPCPQLRPEVPLIWRSSDRVHFGDDPTPMTMSPSEATWLNNLGSFRTWPLARQACPTGELRAEHLMSRARAAHAIDEPGQCWWLSPAQRSTTRPQFLALTSWHPAPDHALAARSAHAIAVRAPDQIASALCDSLRACSFRVVEQRYADVVIIATIGHIDAIDAHDEDLARTHLPIRFHHARATVGPIVVPGRTPCCQCLALHLRDRDSAWPAMAAQWRTHARIQAEVTSTNAELPVDPLLFFRGAVEAITMLREWIDSPSSHASDRIHLEPPHLAPRREPLTAHETCGCLWQYQQRSA